MYKDGAQTLKGRASEQSRAGRNTALAAWQIPQEAVVPHVSRRKRRARGVKAAGGVRVGVSGKRKAETGGDAGAATGGQRSESGLRGSRTAAPESPPGRRSPAPQRVAPLTLGARALSFQRSLWSERSARAARARAQSGGEVRRFLRRLFRRRRRQSWEEAVAAGGSPRSGRRLEAAHRVPARIHDPDEPPEPRCLSVAWVGGEPVLAGRRVVVSRGVGRRRRSGNRRRSRGARGGKGSSGPGRASAGRRLSRRRLRAPAAAATGGIKLCGR